MNESLFLNKTSFLLQKEKHIPILVIVILVFMESLWIMCFVEIRISYKTNALYKPSTNTLEIYWLYNNVDKINQIEKLKIEEQEMDFQIKNISEIKVDGNRNNYQIIEVKSPEKYKENQIIQLKLLDKKERILKKVKKLILGG